MSFFTSLTGLNAATTQLSVTSNNIANAGTTGFKRSRSDFGDIFATSPLQKASTVVGQGTALKQVTQEFSQGNIELSGNSLDLAVTGEGFFPLRSADGQDLFTRNGSFLLDEQNTVVNSAGQFLKVASVDSLGKADFKAELIPLSIAPKTVGEAVATSNIDFGINFPAESLPLTTIDENNLEQIKAFNPEDPSTYAKSAAITIFDENGNDFLLTFYYRRVGVASSTTPFNKWQTHVVLDGQEITPALGQATSSSGTPLFVDKYGNIVPEDELPVVLNDNLVFQKYNLDDLSNPLVSQPATAEGGLVERPYLSDEAGVNFASVPATTSIAINPDQLSGIGATSHAVATTSVGTLPVIFTSIASNVITKADHGFNVGDRIRVSATVGSTNTLATATDYFVTNVTDNTFQLAASLSAATASTPTVVDIDNVASNSASITMTPQDRTAVAVASHGFAVGDRVVYNANSGTVATGLIDGGEYYVTNVQSGTFELATSYAEATSDSPTVVEFSGGNNSQTFDYVETVSLTMTDGDGTVINTLNAHRAAEASIDLINTGDIEANDRISLKLTDEDGTAQIITTSALAADASVTDVIAALNRASSAKTVIFSDITEDSGGTEDYITAASHGFETGDRIVYNAHGNTAIGGLTDGTEYFVYKIDANNFKLATSYAYATASTPTLMSTLTATASNTAHTFDVAEGNGKYRFAAETDVNGDVAISSRIVISRADGKDFKIASDATNHSLSGSAAVHENISSSSPEISSTASALTTNGLFLDTSTTVTELINVLHANAAGTDFEVELATDVSNTINITKNDGTNFTVTATRVPNGTTGLLLGLQSEVSSALAEGAATDATTDGVTAPDFTNAFDLTIDEDPNDVNATDAVTIDLSALNAPENAALSGDEVAQLMTQEINRQFGDQRYFNLSAAANRQFRMTFDEDPGDTTPAQVIDIYIPASSSYTEKSLGTEIQRQLREATGTHLGVQYSRASKGFVFTPENDESQLTISNVPASASLTGSSVPNTLFGLNTLSANFTLDSRGRYAAEVIPNGAEILPFEGEQQRFGITVEFMPNTEEGGTGGSFAISSGQTGDNSAIRIENVSDAAKAYFGLDPDDPTAVLEVVAEEGSTAVRGVQSTAARVTGKPVSINPDETFFVDDLTNEFTVTVDSVTETFRLPVGNYNLNSFKTALQNRINAMEDSRGNSISGVQVNFDQVNEIFTFTSGTTGDSSFFQISGASRYGLEGIDSSVGSTSTYRPPVADQTDNARPIYVTKDENGVFREYSTDTTSGFTPLPGSREFTTDPEYRPLFLDKGELTFDTAGNLISPLGGISLDNVVIGGSGNTLNIDIDYQGSTQFSGDFSVNQQSQNGQPNGSLVAVDIADDGLVTASYSNGTQDLKGKIVLATFSTPNGLRQLGDSTFLESNESGTPTLGEPGGAGFGTIRAGARERANVDLTSELVDLITAQRNFQANAKAIETSSTLTSTIINIRS